MRWATLISLTSIFFKPDTLATKIGNNLPVATDGPLYEEGESMFLSEYTNEFLFYQTEQC